MTVTWRCQVSLQAFDGLPKNVFENVWHFQSAEAQPDGVGALQAADHCATFYAAMAPFLSEVLATHFTIKTYDDFGVKPNKPLNINTYPLVAANPAFPPLPEEVAVCLSYFATTNVAGRRGRLFIGPLNSHAGATDSSEGNAGWRPSSAFRSSMATAATALLAANPMTWMVKSVKASAVYPVTGGWIDDEWDGQSRRRLAATTRTLFPVA